MPLVKNEEGEVVGARCLNDCGELARLEQPAAMVIPGQREPQAMTVLVCPSCQYCEWYYGTAEEE